MFFVQCFFADDASPKGSLAVVGVSEKELGLCFSGVTESTLCPCVFSSTRADDVQLSSSMIDALWVIN